MLFLFLFSVTSCRVVYPNRYHDNGRHRGWHKKPRPHIKKKERDNRYQSQYKGQKADNLITVADYFDWRQENTLKTGLTEKPNE